jgi:transcriptional regulator with XRE-family HTH domain
MEFATIGSALTSRRKSLNLDQARAAAIIGMSRTTFSSYERDLQRPSAEVLPSLAQFLDISLEDILTLYGGTCIQALRPSLERFLATQDGDVSVRTPTTDLGSPATGGAVALERSDDFADTSDPVHSDNSAALADPLDTGKTNGPSVPDDSSVPVGSHDLVDSPDPSSSVAPSKSASVSIFAHELSDELPSPVFSPARPSETEHREVKAAKAKGGGKKKKGKKGKRAKS